MDFAAMMENYFIKALENPEFEIRVQNASVEAKALGVDYVHCSGEFPAVYIKVVDNFQYEALKDIAETKHRIWNQSLVGFLYVASSAELRIYDCNKQPFSPPKELVSLAGALQEHEIECCSKSDLTKLQLLGRVFSFAAIDSGALWNTENNYSKKVDVTKRIDKRLVKALTDVSKEIKADKDHPIEEEVVHRLLMRCLFIMYLQDRQAIPNEIFEKVGSDDFLKTLDVKDTTYKFFRNIVPHFNGNIFPIFEGKDDEITLNHRNEEEQVTTYHLQLIKAALLHGDLNIYQTTLVDWRLFNFKFIRIELLSEIYEGFLKETAPDRQRAQGVYYTPYALVDLILRQVLPTDSKDYKVRVLDPACGSGNFLVQAYQRIVKRWQNAHPKRKLNFKILKDLMEASIFGVEIDPNSIRVAAFSLYLTMLNYLDPADVWLKGADKFPNLIRDPERGIGESGKGNLFREDTIGTNSEYQRYGYDIIVGNPPFGTKDLEQGIKDYCAKFGFAPQYAIPFMHRLAELHPRAKIAFVFNTSLLFSTGGTSQNFRQWIFNDCSVEKVYNLSILRKARKIFGGQLFSSATVPICVAFYQRESTENESSTIEYWAPKTCVRNLLSENVLIDGSDIKYVPRYMSKDPTSNIWKIAQWGTLQDYYLIRNLQARNDGTFKSYLEEGRFIHNVGLQPMGKAISKHKDDVEIQNLGYLDSAKIDRYYTPEGCKTDINECIKSKEAITYYTDYFGEEDRNKWPKMSRFRGIGENKAIYLAPHVLIKEGMSGNQVCASFLDYPTTFTKAVLGIKGSSPEVLKAITGYLNSKLCSYILFLTTASWGIERDRVEPNELYDLPKFPDALDIEALSTEIDNLIALKKKRFAEESQKGGHLGGLFASPSQADGSKQDIVTIDDIEKSIDDLIFNGFVISESERMLIEDQVDFSIDLFQKKEKSQALQPIELGGEFLRIYATILQDTLNHEFEDEEIMITVRPYAPVAENNLCIVVASFVNAGKKGKVKIEKSSAGFNSILKDLNQYSIQEHSQNVFVQKHILHFSGDDIFILKPNQTRHCTRSVAIEDAYTIVAEIMNQKER